MYIIEADNIVRDYKVITGTLKRSRSKVRAVNGLSFSVKEGEIYGLLGPNGAGKTTTIKMMTTLLVPSKGTLKVLGHDVTKDYKAIRESINFVFGGERNLYWRLSGEDNLKFFADIFKVPRQAQKELIDALLKRVGLYEDRHKKVETYSKGMKQRLQIAKALINEPKVLFMDEPTIGLDPVGAKLLRQIIKEEAAKGTTIILTTHYMGEAEELCDRIAIINKGEFVAQGNIDELRSIYKTHGQLSLEDIYLRLMEATEEVKESSRGA